MALGFDVAAFALSILLLLGLEALEERAANRHRGELLEDDGRHVRIVPAPPYDWERDR